MRHETCSSGHTSTVLGVGQPSARLLYVEDDEILRNCGALALTTAGYEVATAADGVEGWMALDAAPFDLVLTDNQMPRLTGLELIAKARQQGFTVPFIVTSSFLGSVADAQNQWLKISATLQKPFGSAVLLATVRRVLSAERQTTSGVEIAAQRLADFSRRNSYAHWGINE